MKVFRSDSDCDIPMVEERIEVMHEAGKALLKVILFKVTATANSFN